jgi:hypothetical protein
MGLRPIPNLLHKQIKFASMLPPPDKLPGAEDRAVWVREHWDGDEEQIKKLKEKHPRFRKYMKGADLETSPAEFVRRCRALKMTRELLYTIARMSKNMSAGKRLPIRSSFEDELVTAVTDQEGKFRVEHHPLLLAIEGVEVSRIRECDVCRQIFWAKRTDQLCCKRRCAKTLRTRRWRQGYVDRYQIQRFHKANAKDNIDQKLEQERVESLDDMRRAARLRKRRK